MAASPVSQCCLPTVPLAPLLAASRAVITVNSTVALDAAVAGVPALVIGLPNNLSPFVDAGALAGAKPVKRSVISSAASCMMKDSGHSWKRRVGRSSAPTR